MKLFKFLGILFLLAAAMWIGVGELDLPEETKRDLRKRIAQLLLGALTVGLAVMALGSLSTAALWGTAAAAGAATIWGPGIADSLSRAVEGLEDRLRGNGDGGDTSIRCGDPGSCFRVIDGSLCLGTHCLEETSQ
ncbi:MAG: hypothetical protein GWM92_15815 [Gemmatimonadetes bacterium]|nr:hypothetical protein [Gemmatimonadota bacterium]NIR80199.1 hypothetical protein [Gemmatimonadota bacterium]NIT88961.1 hypothetical protein [Gemmatimonadota bacterium]NIU32756.1 hypothetical protein [Gemmatimonadota bacterium]NIU37188.1 hypothetical protein [Gemmatimonadota bacterium]